MRLKRAIFLDRDGTLNRDTGYTHKIEDWQWLPGALEALAKFTKAGWLLIVVSNQSGIGRGYYTAAQLQKLEDWLKQELKKQKIEIASWCYCPHLPDAACQCRKPKPGMLLHAAKELDLFLPHCWMLGDKISDVQAGLAAGCHAGLIARDNAPEKIKLHKIYPQAPAWPDLLTAANAILQSGES